MKCLIHLRLLIPVLILFRMETNAEMSFEKAHKMRVAVIGAGAAGLASARFCTDPVLNFSCEIFEQSDELGGTWVYNPRKGLDDFGLPIHTSMYHDLVTNLPKEVMKFPDFKFPDYDQSFITHSQVLKYLQDYAKHYNLEQFIKFRHLVNEVRPLPNDKWSITVTNLRNKTNFTKEFDAVLVCNGHYSKPVVPKLLGQDLYKGTQIHSHDYRTSQEYKNKTVLIIGAGPSGFDLTSRVAQFATKVILSYRTMKRPWTLPANVILKPTTTEFTENWAVFADGTTEQIDAVIYCTGYEYSFPFLAKECGITVDSNAVQPLYKHIVNIERPTMGFIGLMFAVIPFPLFHYQVLLFLKHLNGDIELPSREEMYLDTEKDLELRKEKGFPKRYTHKLSFDFQEPYFQDIAKVAQVKPLPPVIFKIYADTSLKPNREKRFKIIDDENYQGWLKNETENEFDKRQVNSNENAS